MTSRKLNRDFDDERDRATPDHHTTVAQIGKSDLLAIAKSFRMGADLLKISYGEKAANSARAIAMGEVK
ncbi:MAG: hypothetical protein SW833_19025 [Cyanobacteriota bacterium]|nr:hypothetical protein [Cyanobacteriota bacterium]